MRKRFPKKVIGATLAVALVQIGGGASAQKTNDLSAYLTHFFTVASGEARGPVSGGLEASPAMVNPMESAAEDICDKHVKARVVGIVPVTGLAGAYEILVEWHSAGLPNCFKLKRVDFTLRLANGQVTETSSEVFGVFENPARIRLRNLGSKPLKAEAVVYIGGPATGSGTKEGAFE